MKNTPVQNRIPSSLIQLVALLVPLAWGASLPAQTGAGSYPNLNYYSAYNLLREGNFQDALDAFDNSARSGKRTVRGVWVDSICYRTMLGETYYRMGNLRLALEQYNAAMQLFVLNAGWMNRVEFAGIQLRPSTRQVRPPVTWIARKARMAAIPNRFNVGLGRVDNINVVRNGGVIEPPQLITVNVHEIARCTALALRRRFEILGPVGVYDPLTSKITAAMDAPAGPVNHWSQAWVNAQRGYALAAAGKPDEAERAFKSAVLLGGQYDHPLTSTALMGLGQISVWKGANEEAVQYFLNASASAAAYEQFETMEDAFLWASDAHLSLGNSQPFKPLSPAVAYARRRRVPHLQAALTTLAAENLTHIGNPSGAGRMLAQTRKSISRRNSLAAYFQTRLLYVQAHAGHQVGKTEAATKSLSQALTLQKNISSWQFQISMTDRLYVDRSSGLSPRNAAKLFEKLLREPTVQDWKLRPLDTLSYLNTPNRVPYERWFGIALDRGESDTALEIGDRMRRRSFYSALPLGGRLLSLRWLIESPENGMDAKHVELRNDLMARYPRLNKLGAQSRTLREQLSELPISNANEEQVLQQKKLGEQLGEVVKAHEAVLSDIALRREYSPFLFPPVATTTSIQESLTPGQLALIYVSTSKGLYAFMLSQKEYGGWKIPDSMSLRKETILALRSFGLTSESGQVSPEKLQSESWKKLGLAVRTRLIDQSQEGFWNKFEELVIVPAGQLWYVPFEALPVGEGDNVQPLLTKMRIRYLPTAGLIGRQTQPNERVRLTAVVVGKLFPRDDASLAKDNLESMTAVVDDLHPLPERLPAGSGLLRTTWDRLLVLDDISNAIESPLDWSPGRIDAARPGGSLRRWMELPWGGPRQVLLPGFHTASESSLKRKGRTGEEVFLATMGLMASGADTVLLSRWRTGGVTCFDLMREFLQEEPDTSPARAWQRAVRVVGETPVDPEWEPRVGRAQKDEVLSASHPFFWAGYMLIDAAGERDDESEVEADEDGEADGASETKPAAEKEEIKLDEEAEEKPVGDE